MRNINRTFKILAQSKAIQPGVHYKSAIIGVTPIISITPIIGVTPPGLVVLHYLYNPYY